MQQHGVMEANMVWAHSPDPRGEVKIQLFQNMVMLHIKLN